MWRKQTKIWPERHETDDPEQKSDEKEREWIRNKSLKEIASW